MTKNRVKVAGYFRPRDVEVDEEKGRILLQVTTHNEKYPCRHCVQNITQIEARMKELGIIDYQLEERGDSKWFNFPLPEDQRAEPLKHLTHLIDMEVREISGSCMG